MNIAGKIKLIKETQSITENFQKREFVVTTQGEYPNDIIMEFTQDKCSILDQYQEGDNVDVSINIRGREWINPQGEAKYFNTIQAWRIDNLEAQPLQLRSGDLRSQEAPGETQEEEDDLPF